MTGSADATGPNAGFDPLGGRRRNLGNVVVTISRRKCSPLRAQKDTSYLPYLISYDGSEQYVLYSKSEAQLKIELRKIYRPENFKKLAIKRLYPNDVIQFYWKKRQQALRAD